jgi:hypothetical protein
MDLLNLSEPEIFIGDADLPVIIKFDDSIKNNSKKRKFSKSKTKSKTNEIPENSFDDTSIKDPFRVISKIENKEVKEARQNRNGYVPVSKLVRELCPHGRYSKFCYRCGSCRVCIHDRQKSKCKECGGSSLCKHGREKVSK